MPWADTFKNPSETSNNSRLPAPESTKRDHPSIIAGSSRDGSTERVSWATWASAIQAMVALTEIRHSRCRPEVEHPPRMS
ncbi:hypothetical protein CCMA1212_001591 [Trichoderma ghanense]|uniref:Uncharacterized protein n=1 Tax=Trichoderma ghanense TaxID=65468 RepID=A0ABY2HE56_9HYPO